LKSVIIHGMIPFDEEIDDLEINSGNFELFLSPHISDLIKDSTVLISKVLATDDEENKIFTFCDLKPERVCDDDRIELSSQPLVKFSSREW